MSTAPQDREPVESQVIVRTGPARSGYGYDVILEADPDAAPRRMSPSECLHYANTVLAATHRAAYDAAVIDQLTSLNHDLEAAGQLINILRQRRKPLPDKATRPLSFVPGVSVFTREPFLTVNLHGAPLGQWTVSDALDHATAVLELIEVARLDSGYLRLLVEDVGLDEDTALRVVDGLADHRHQGPRGDR